MPAVALRIEEPVVNTCIEKYTKQLCRRWRVPRGDIKDVVQEVLTEIHASRASFQPGRGDYVQWTQGIAWKVIRRHVHDGEQYTKRFAEYPANIEQYPSLSPSPERHAQHRQAQDAILTGLNNLSALNHDVFVLHVVEDLTHAEVSETLQLTPANAQKCFQRARDQLAECISDEILVAMPPNLSSCEESISTQRHTRWHERSHYIVQVSTLIMAFILGLSREPSTRIPPLFEDELVQGAEQNAAMFAHDKRAEVQDEPSVLPDAPSVKPEPAFLPSVREASKPTKLRDKPPPLPQYVPRLSYKHEPRGIDHRPLGR
ncbi:MAG TPA: sigma-70 family RNA polymerase sigma factor [Polyangium sp.]|nr:sigma-70 family RNA polymerase sigma factor [Polyangium sp.]